MALYFLIAGFAIPNAILFGASYLLARPFTRPGSWLRVVATVGIASIVAFGPRVPGMVDDLHYHFSSQRQMQVIEPVTLPAGARIGWLGRVESSPATRNGGEQLIEFRERYFPTVRSGVENGAFQGVRLRSEDPVASLRETGLILNSGKPDAETVLVSLTGSRTDSHLTFEVVISEQGRVIGRYSDRYRLRWPGMASDPDSFSLFAYLTQFSVLDYIADAAYSGRMVGQWRPVGDFISKVIRVGPESTEVAVPAKALTRRTDKDSLPFQTTSPASRVEGCTPTLVDRDLLRNGDTGLVRKVRHDWPLAAEKYAGPAASECTTHGLAMAYAGTRPGAIMIAEYADTLQTSCVMMASVAPEMVTAGTDLVLVGLTGTSIGFQVDLAMKTGEKFTGAHLLVDVERPGACTTGPPGAATPTAAETTDGDIWIQARAETRQLANRLTEPWDGLLLQQADRAWTEAQARCGIAGGDGTLPADLALEARSCLHDAGTAWQQANLKLGLVVAGDRRDFRFSARDLATLGPLAPRIYIVRDRGPPQGRSDVGSMEPNTLFLRETERPLILILEMQTHRIWHLRKLPGVWLAGWSQTCPQPCPVGRDTLRTLGLGFDLDDHSGDSSVVANRGLDQQVVVVPESGSLTFGSGTGEFPVSPAPYDIYADQYVKATPAAEEPIEGPDRFDRMVEAAADRSRQEQVEKRSRSFQDLRAGIGKLPSPMAIRDLALWSPDVTVTVDHPTGPVFLVVHGGTTQSLTVHTRAGTRLAGIFLDKKAERLKLALPRGVPVFGETASGDGAIQNAFFLLVDKVNHQGDVRAGYIADKSEFLLQ